MLQAFSQATGFLALPAATSQTINVVSQKTDQTISFTSPTPASAKVGGTYTPAATATSGLSVAFSVAPASTSVCAISGGVVRFNATGSCVVQGDQPGNAGFNAAPQVTQAFSVGIADQTISFTSPAPASAKVGGTYTPAATATSGLSVAFSVAPASASVCSISGGVVTFNAIGSCVVQADQAGDTGFNAAPQETQAFSVGKGDQTISFTSAI
ncbi:MAG: hypothetical protein K2Y29_02770, partial [Beijerinckiaceae bacterium]|nr:hypothetical protein [Beijerinckiaceae bacterium]